MTLAALRRHGRVVRELLIVGERPDWTTMIEEASAAGASEATGSPPVPRWSASGAPVCDRATRPLHVWPGRISVRLAPRWVAARRIQTAIDEAVARHQAQSCVLHVWSPQALAWAAPAARPSAPMLIDSDVDDRLDRAVRWRQAMPAGVAVGFRVPSAAAQAALFVRGISPEHVALIRGFVDYAAINEARRGDARRRLGLDAEATVLLLLPPISPAAGSFTALWAALLLEKIRREVRVLIPRGGSESRRLTALAEATRHQQVLSLVEPGEGLPLLLAASNVALLTPPGDAPTWALPWAMAGGVRVVATAVPAVTEMLAHGHNAWLCRPASPKDTCRRILHALERPEESRRLCEAARSGAFRVFSRQRMVEQYEQAYANLLAGRGAGAGVRDAALVA